MQIEPTEPPGGHDETRRGVRRVLLRGGALGAYTLLILLAVVWIDPLRAFHSFTVELGSLEPMGVRAALVTGPANWLRAMRQEPRVPELTIDIKLPHVQKLELKRRDALARGVLTQSPDDFVPAVIRSDDRSVRVKLRLKGDWTDHLASDKWSLRVHVRGDDHLLGMRRLSLQHPKVRGYQAELLFFDALRREGVLVPRYSLARVTVNGKSIGLMAVEEHFSKELLESQGRRESVIIRFDESLVFASMDGNQMGFGGVFDSFANSTIDVFRMAKVERSEVLSADADLAVGLLRGFVEGELRPAAVFDTETMGHFLAVAEVWGAVHAVRWHNLRFYYDPITALLEPIGFDADAHFLLPTQEPIAATEPFVTAVLADDAIRSVYHRAVLRIAREFDNEERLQQLKNLEKEALASLHREFPLIEPFAVEKIIERAAVLTSRGSEPSPSAKPKPPVKGRGYAALVRAYVIPHDRSPYLELMAAVPEAVEIRSVRYLSIDDSRKSSLVSEFPRRLDGTPIGSVPATVRVPLDTRANDPSLRLEVSAVIEGQQELFVATATRYRPLLDRRPIPSPTLEETIERHPFLRPGDTPGALRVEAGSWDVDGSIVLPRGVSLLIVGGTRLRFLPGAALIVQGAVQLRGSAESRVILEASSEMGWQGVFVSRATTGSRWSHVTVRNTTGVGSGKWNLTGGVTFYQSDIKFEHCIFEGSRAEDALNIVRSKFEMDSVVIRDTVSDGLDADFSDGRIRRGLFERIGEAGGGDAIDVSGSTVRVTETQIHTVSDKGLSVGEASQMIATGLVIQDVGTGAASKDGSELTISNSSIRASRTAPLMAYMKKSEYGPATITATRLQTDGEGPVARAQIGSAISVDGLAVETESIDVDALYRTSMRSRLRK